MLPARARPLAEPFRLALAPINSAVGDLAGNRDRILESVRCAEQFGADLVAFPELVLTGFPPEDLLLKPSFIRDNLQVLDELARAAGDIVVVVGCVDRADDIFNAAAVLHLGRVVHLYHASDNQAVVAYVNLVGGQDELVFDGSSLIFDSGGELLGQGRAFKEDLLVVDGDVAGVFRERLHDPRGRKSHLRREADTPTRVIEIAAPRPMARKRPPLPARAPVEDLGPVEETYHALVLGTRDYVCKTGFGRWLRHPLRRHGRWLRGHQRRAQDARVRARALPNRLGERPVIPESVLSKPPSADLRPDQTDQDSLPPYDELDAILVAYVEEDRSLEKIVRLGYAVAIAGCRLRIVIATRAE
jgi:hypothetical protein